MTQSYSGNRLAISNPDLGTVKIFDGNDHELIAQLPVAKYDRGRLAENNGGLAIDDNHLTVANGNALLRFRLPQRDLDYVTTSSDWYAPFAIANSAGTVAFPSKSGQVAIWHPGNSDEIRYVGTKSDTHVHALAISQDGQTLAVASIPPTLSVDRDEDKSQLEIWGLEEKDIRSTLQAIDCVVWNLSFDPRDSNQVLYSGNHGNAQVWNVATGATTPLSNRDAEGTILGSSFSSSGHYILVGANTWLNSSGQAAPALLWEQRANDILELVATIPVEQTYAVGISSSERLAGFCESRDPIVQLFDMISGKLPSRFTLALRVFCPLIFRQETNALSSLVEAVNLSSLITSQAMNSEFSA